MEAIYYSVLHLTMNTFNFDCYQFIQTKQLLRVDTYSSCIHLKKGPMPHEPVLGTDVPQSHKLWTIDKRVVLSLFSSIGVGKRML